MTIHINNIQPKAEDKQPYYIMIWNDDKAPSYTILTPFSSFNKAVKNAVKYTKEHKCMFTINNPYFRNWLNINNANTI